MHFLLNLLNQFTYLRHFFYHPFVVLVLIYEIVRITTIMVTSAILGTTFILKNFISTFQYQLSLLFIVAIAFILATNYIRKSRSSITFLCVFIFPVFIVLNTIDSILYGLIGMRLTPSVLLNQLNLDWTHPLFRRMLFDYLIPILLVPRHECGYGYLVIQIS